jgi:hypothetical protein
MSVNDTTLFLVGENVKEAQRLFLKKDEPKITKFKEPGKSVSNLFF